MTRTLSKTAAQALTDSATACAENCAKLPDLCYGVHLSTGETIIIKRGEIGYHDTGYGVQGEEAVNSINDRLGVTRAQRAAMEAGSVFGFHLPIANVDIYDALGKRIAR